MHGFDPRPILPRTPPPPDNGPPDTTPEWLKALAVVGGGIAVGVLGAALIDALTETPSERLRRELNGTRLGLPKGRISLPRWYRDEISRAHNWRCVYCGVRTTRTTRQIDHATSVANGGSNEPRNLVNACDACNQLKGAMNAEQFRAFLRSLL